MIIPSPKETLDHQFVLELCQIRYTEQTIPYLKKELLQVSLEGFHQSRFVGRGLDHFSSIERNRILHFEPGLSPNLLSTQNTREKEILAWLKTDTPSNTVYLATVQKKFRPI